MSDIIAYIYKQAESLQKRPRMYARSAESFEAMQLMLQTMAHELAGKPPRQWLEAYAVESVKYRSEDLKEEEVLRVQPFLSFSYKLQDVDTMAAAFAVVQERMKKHLTTCSTG